MMKKRAAKKKSKSVKPAAQGKERGQQSAGAGTAAADWRADTLARVRSLIEQAVPGVTEELKWRGVPVWSLNGILCTGETYKAVVKFTFAKGASLDDPARLFNSSLGGSTRRAIDIREGDRVNEKALKALVRAAADLNASVSADRKSAKPRRAAGESATNRPRPLANDTTPKLLSGGNPQIAKGYGEGPVQEYIAAIPGWKRDIGGRLDTLVSRVVPGVRKAVKWNSPLYGVDNPSEKSWFLGVHCFNKYIKLAFFNGASLVPLPPGASRQKTVRYLDIHESDWGNKVSEVQIAEWVRQASALPGEEM